MGETCTVKLADSRSCTGCGACKNTCPCHAIEMKADFEGFFQPAIDDSKCVVCGLCMKKCPVLHPEYHNNPAPKSYAIMANDDVRAISSSGGFFTLIAENILDQGGLVYGAAWTNDWNVAHISVDSSEQLELIRSSKYLQSDTRNTYCEAKSALDEGRKVLYSGCPCQIAGLYAYLGRNYDNLYTAEVICHGVPSPKVFEKYLADNFKGESIKQVNFRDKSIYKWSSTSNLYFENGNEYHKTEKEDPYYKAFLPCMIMRNSCACCTFSKLPRQADISMGDFWGSEQYKKGLNDHKGLSAILVNSLKGKVLFEDVQRKFKYCEEVPLDAITLVNKTVLHPFRSHPGRKHFFSSMNIKPFNQLVENSLNHHYDIGVVGLWYGINYGSVLTYYALYSLLRDLGYDAVMLPRPRKLWERVAERFDREDSIAQRFIWKYCNVFLPVKYQEDYWRFNDNCDSFVLGSDVVWNYNICGRDVDQFFFLDWVEKGHKKIAYASSFGNGLKGPDEYVQKAIYNLKQFDAISIRESEGVDNARKVCCRDDIEHVLDPVFACNPQIYEKVIKGIRQEEKSVFAYLLNDDYHAEKIELLNRACKKFETSKKVCINPNERERLSRVYPDSFGRNISVEEWLYHIKNARFYIGDSYHGLCFALIFHIPFIIVYRRDATTSTEARFLSLLRIVELEERFVTDFENTDSFDQILEKEIDWKQVDARMDSMRKKSLDWIKAALKQETRMATNEDRIVEGKLRVNNKSIVAIYERLERMEADNAFLKERIQSIESKRIIHQIKKYTKKVLKTYKEHGMKYTLSIISQKISRKIG